MEEQPFVSIDTAIECRIIKRKELREALETLAGEHYEYPCKVSFDERERHDGIYSLFEIAVSGRPDKVEDMAYRIDGECRPFAVCTHEKLQLN